MTQDRLVVHVSSKVRRRWMLRLGLWLVSRCTVEVFADGKSLGKHRIVDIEYDEEPEG